MAIFIVRNSTFLANELFYFGHTPILVYKGRFEDWKANQLPIEIGAEEDECW